MMPVLFGESLVRRREVGFPGFILIFATAFLCFCGCIALYSSASGHVKPWAIKHFLASIFFGLFALVIANLRRDFISRYAYHLYAFSLICVISVFGFGRSVAGVQRWIHFAHFSLQPSEIMKFSVVLALSKYFSENSELRETPISRFLISLLFPIIPAVFVLYQPNLGTAVAIIITSSMIFFVVGIQMRIVMSCVLLIFLSSPFMWNHLKDYQKKRIVTFLNLNNDALGNGYNIRQSMIAIGSGGLGGKGFLHGKQNQLNFIPAKHTDFILSVFAEEFGFIGILMIFAAYVILVLSCYVIGFQSCNYYGKILCVGVGSMIFTYVVLNAAMISGMIPVVGIPLPLVSYGRSNLSVNLIAIGFVLNVHLNRKVGCI